MKIFKFFIFTIIPIQIIAQQGFEGKYVTSKKKSSYSNEIFEFKKDGSFKYSISTCTGKSLGKGIYKIIKSDSLQLTFRDCYECPKNIDLQFLTFQSDSVEIDIKTIASDDSLPLSGASVFFQNSKKGINSDINGFANFKVKKTIKPQILILEYVGYQAMSVIILPEVSKITGIINFSYENVFEKGEKLTFKIVNWSKSKLKLKMGENIITYYSKQIRIFNNFRMT